VDSRFKYFSGDTNQFDHGFEGTGPYYRQFLILDYHPLHVIDNKVDYYNHPYHWIYSGLPQLTIIDKGEIKLLEKTWYFANTFEKNDSGCTLNKHLRRFTSDNNLFLIMYSKWLPELKCAIWEESLKLNDDRKKSLDAFNQSFQEVVKMRKSSSAPSSDENGDAVATMASDNSLSHQEVFSSAVKAYDDKEYAKALSLWKDLATRGNKEAMYRIAKLYEHGLGTEKDSDRAMHYYRKSSISGYGEAQHHYASKLESKRNAYFWYKTLEKNHTATPDLRSEARAKAEKFENIYGFSLTKNEETLLSTLQEYTSAKHANTEESLFTGY